VKILPNLAKNPQIREKNKLYENELIVKEDAFRIM